MNWEEVKDLLKEAHEEPIAAADYAAVRARVMSELARRSRPWWPLGRVWAAAASAAVLLVAARVDWSPNVEPLPAVALAYPAAPEVRKVTPRPQRALKAPKTKGESLLVRVVTDDPDVVIYWIADAKGEY